MCLKGRRKDSEEAELQPEEEEKKLEEEDLEHKGESPVTLNSKRNMVEEVTLVEEDLTKEVEVEE